MERSRLFLVSRPSFKQPLWSRRGSSQRSGPLQNFREDRLGATRCVFASEASGSGVVMCGAGGADSGCCNPEPVSRQIRQFRYEQTFPSRWMDLITCTPAVRVGSDHFWPSKQTNKQKSGGLFFLALLQPELCIIAKPNPLILQALLMFTWLKPSV